MVYYPKVLVAIPTYQGKDYIFKENFDAVKNFDYPNYDYIYIDNSSGTSYLSTLRKRGAKAVRVPRNGNSRIALANAQNYARHRAIDGNYDYLMFVESDLVPPKDIIGKLVRYKAKVMGATYLIGHKIKIPCVFFAEKDNLSYADKTRLIRLNEVESFLNSGVRQVHGMGMGCTLLRRDIFEKYPFWIDERMDNKHSDVYYYMTLQNDGVPVFVDTNVLIEHHPSKWSDVRDK